MSVEWKTGVYDNGNGNKECWSIKNLLGYITIYKENDNKYVWKIIDSLKNQEGYTSTLEGSKKDSLLFATFMLRDYIFDCVDKTNQARALMFEYQANISHNQTIGEHE